MIRKLLVLLLLIALIGALALEETKKRWQQPLQIPPQGFAFTVERGDSLRAVADRLHAANVLEHPMLLQLFGRWTGQDQKLKQGEYLLPAGATAEAVLVLLQSGRVIQYQVTLPEGITLARALAILAQEQPLTNILEGPSDPRVMELVSPHLSAEGLFFPDSYNYVRGATDWSILQRAHTAMVSTLESEWQNRAAELPYERPYEALIMASIIERETGLVEERGEIAGVFVRRLQKGMRLQTDPTVIYGLGAEFDGNLRRQHLGDGANPYNTYRHHGLPPSPIALPGRDAIHAALHPVAGNSLYFVARGDGGHVFSPSLAEHNKAVRKYQLRRRKDYRSTPETP